MMIHQPDSLPMPDPLTGEAICTALRRQAEKQGVSLGAEPDWSLAQFTEEVDQATGETRLMAVWKGGARYGTVSFFPDGRVFAEYQVLLPHPTRQDAYVEAVQVWGTPDALRGDAVVTAYLV